MTSETGYNEAFVWVWMPDEIRPIVAGRLAAAGDQLVFNYGRSYLARKNAISLYEPELPLRSGPLPLLNGLRMPNCIRDAGAGRLGAARHHQSQTRRSPAGNRHSGTR